MTPAGRLDLPALAAAFAQHKPAAYLLCSPHNPHGTVHTPDELAAVARLAREHRVRVISDEIHAPLVAPGVTFTPYLAIEGTDDAYIVTSASKSFNLAPLVVPVVTDQGVYHCQDTGLGNAQQHARPENVVKVVKQQRR